MNAKTSQPRAARPQARRLQERQVRCEAVAFGRWLHRRGLPWSVAAACLHLRPNTLRRWHRRWHRDRLRALDRGRPAHPADGVTRSAVLEVLEDLGPSLGVPTLKLQFPQVPRRELGDLCAAHRRRLRATLLEDACALCWRGAGRVWAADFTEVPVPIDGVYPYLLLVRDLASGRQLLALPALHEDAAAAVAALTELFAQHGPPLVLKIDNGSCFIADECQDFLARHQVAVLFSPPRTPRYNGAVEAGNGSLKTHLRREALRHGRPDWWTSDDVEAACVTPNALAHPHGPYAPTPDQAWAQAAPLTAAERERFRQTLDEARKEVMMERGLTSEDLSDRAARASVDRAAIRRTLERLGYLCLRRGRISSPIYAAKC